MIRTLIVVGAAVASLFSTSCFCCTGDPAPPKLRRLPHFHPIPTADAPAEVIPTK